MTIEFRCRGCGKQQSAPDYSIGRSFKCQCGRTLVVPGVRSVSLWPIVAVVAAVMLLPVLFMAFWQSGGESGLVDRTASEAEAPPIAADSQDAPKEWADAPHPPQPEETQVPDADYPPVPFSALKHTAPRKGVGATGVSPTPRQANAQARMTEGDALYARGAYKGALSAYRSALEADPGNRATRRRVAVALFSTGDLDGAIAEAKSLVAEDREDPDSRFVLGCIYRRSHDYVNGRSELRAAVELAPTDLDARSELAATLREVGDGEAAMAQVYEAVAVCRKMLKDAPRDAGLLTRLGGLLASVGNREEAEEALHQAVRLGAKDGGSCLELGEAYLALGALDEARRYAQMAKGYGEAGAEDLFRKIQEASSAGAKTETPAAAAEAAKE